MPSCSTKKNTAASRKYQAFITRYNVYFNGDEHFRETLKSMEQSYEDDYSDILFTHPADAKADPKAPQPSGDFNRSIEKAQKAIQLHSIKKKPRRKPGYGSDPAYKAWLKRDEYNPFLHNAWLMMGRSQYFNGDFLGAASTFYYITKHFTWLPATVTEARLWQARAYVAMDWLYEAEVLINRTKPAELTTGTLRQLYDFVSADYYVRSRQFDKAAPYLEAAAKAAKGSQKPRLYFLLGQVYSRLGMKEQAYTAFHKAGSSPGVPYRTKFNTRIRQSEVFAGSDITSEVNALRRMIRYDRNKDYLDQIYYAIGNLYLSRGDTLNAIDNYILAADRSTRNGIDKAISQITLGGLYFDRGEYDLAQPRYSEAMPQLPEDYPDYQTLKRRSDVLDELAVYSRNVQLQDSLLRLAAMDSTSRMAVIERIIDDLNRREREEAELAKREEYLAQQAANGTGLTNSANAPGSFQLNTDNSWYFYNQATLAAGRSDFQRRWGSRKLEDDWRRRNKASFSFNDFNNTPDDDDSGSETDSAPTGASGDEQLQGNEDDRASGPDKIDRTTDPHYPEYYLAQIPSTELEILNSHDVIREGLFNMGLILKDKLEDYPAAETEWNRLLERYPDNVYRLDIYYNLYLMYMRLGDTTSAERWRQLILNEFPDSKYGMALRDPEYIRHLREMPARQQHMYDQAYEAYLADDNAAVHEAYAEMMRTYPLSDIMPKFMFLHALAYVTENRPEEFKSTLHEMLQRYPETDMTPLASSYLKGLAQGRELHRGSSNMRGMLWDIRLSNDSAAANADTPLEFDMNPDVKHMLVLLFPTDSVSANQLLFEVARHNFSSFVVKDFDLEMMNFGRLGLLLVKGFDNLDELHHYRRVMETGKGLDLPPQVRSVMISVDNFNTLIRHGGSFEEYFRYIEDEDSRRTHEQVLPPDQYEGPPEIAPDTMSPPEDDDDQDQ
ncbi:MAG: tetratricopeptide repeat protein [Muribaculaceae bacterium]|nr:tetratricopeptide repeat protein [Muribaculaceae bacterium]